MKTLLFAACVLAASLLSSCKQDPQSAMGPNLPLNSPSTPAHPAITYVSTPVIHNATYYAIGVEDTTGANKTNLVTAASNSNSETFLSPCWNYSGGSITYKDVAGTTNSIKAFDVSVNSNGVPVSSNERTIYSLATSDSAVIQSGPAWCATSSTGEIAFTRNHLGSELGLSELCTISQSSGTVTVLASYRKLNTNGIVMSHFLSPTWSPDDSKIAVIREDTIKHFTIMIFNASTGAAEDSIPISLNAGVIGGIEWSRTGTNELVFTRIPNGGSTYEIYYVAPSTGSTPSTNSVVGNSPTWSPNNSGIMYINSALKKVMPFTTTTTTVASSPGGSSLNWKR
ncbi:MAG: TolB family protein [Candidatus Kapaibacterium sp.]